MSFIETVAEGAVTLRGKILPSVVIAQAILESDWGKSGLALQANNLFGIKGDYNGQHVTMPTREYVSGKWTEIQANFRKYPSFKESISDHADLFLNGVSWDHDHYRNIIGEKDYKTAVEYLYQDGYATDPGYAKKLTDLIEQYHLDHYDVEEQLSKPRPKPSASAIRPYPGHVFKLTNPYTKDKGTDIEAIQRALGITVDGIYGPQTETAVKAYQKNHSLIVDGIVGPVTWNTLF